MPSTVFATSFSLALSPPGNAFASSSFSYSPPGNAFASSFSYSPPGNAFLLYQRTLPVVILIESWTVLAVFKPIGKKPITLTFYFQLVDQYQPIALSGIHWWQSISALGEVTTTFLIQLPRPFLCGATHTWHVETFTRGTWKHLHVVRGSLITWSLFFAVTWKHSHVIIFNCHQ